MIEYILDEHTIGDDHDPTGLLQRLKLFHPTRTFEEIHTCRRAPLLQLPFPVGNDRLGGEDKNVFSRPFFGRVKDGTHIGGDLNSLSETHIISKDPPTAHASKTPHPFQRLALVLVQLAEDVGVNAKVLIGAFENVVGRHAVVEETSFDPARCGEVKKG